MRAWQAISLDPITGDEQPGATYWRRIWNHFWCNNKVEYFGLKFLSLIVGEQFKLLAPSGLIPWSKLTVSIQVVQVLEIR